MTAATVETQRAAALPGVEWAAASEISDVLVALATTVDGLSTPVAAKRLEEIGPNVLRTHRARPWRVLGRQLKSPILLLLLVTALLSVFLGEAVNAVIIGVILTASIFMGFMNEFRAERAADALARSDQTHRGRAA